MRNRFVQAAILLHMLDSVRGEPTIRGLHENSHKIQILRERFLERKLLDSFALVCAIKRDGAKRSLCAWIHCVPGRVDGTRLRNQIFLKLGFTKFLAQ